MNKLFKQISLICGVAMVLTFFFLEPPQVLASVYNLPWRVDSLSTPLAYPQPLNGVYAPIEVPYITATSTTASTFAGPVQLTPLAVAGGSFLAVNPSGQIIATTTPSGGGSGTVTSVGATTPTGLTVTGSPITTSGTLAFGLQSGYNIPLTASTTDWNNFYQGSTTLPYQAQGNYITALTGDVTASGPGSSVATLSTVNSNTGSFGSSTAIPNFTVNGKGLITAAGTNAVVAPAGTLTGSTLASGVTGSSLTSVGTIGTGVWNGSTIQPGYGGTGISTSPAYGNVLLGNSSGGYTLVATSSLGLGNGTVTSVGFSGGTTGLTETGSPVTSSGTVTLSGTLDAANGGTGSTTLSGILLGNGTGAVKTAVGDVNYQNPISLTTSGTSGAATFSGDTLNIPNYANSGGTVTSVAETVPTGLTISGSPITTSGTLAVGLQSGYNIPLTASTTDWNNFYATPSTQITAGTNLSWSGNTLNATGGGSGTGNVSTSSVPVIGDLAYWTTNTATPALLSSVGTSTVSATSPLTGSVTEIGSGGSLGIQVANGTQNGYLSSTDWNTFNNKGSGSVTSVAETVPTGLSISGSPITTSGTLAVGLQTGYNIPLTASTTNWNNFYNTPSTQITAGTGLSWSGNTLNASGGGTNYLTNSGANTYLNTGSNLEAPYFTATSTATSTFGGPIAMTGPIAVGSGSYATGAKASAFGYDNTAPTTNSSAFGYCNIASGSFSSASGYHNTASGYKSAVFGYLNAASGNFGSAAFGAYNSASGYSSSASGYRNISSGVNATASGSYNTASGNNSTIIGFCNTACGSFSTIGGSCNTASACLSSAFGSCLNNSIANSVMIGPSQSAAATILSTGNFEAPFFTATSTTASTFAGPVQLTPLAVAAGSFLAVNPSGQIIATTTPSGGGGSPSGATGSIQINNAGAFGTLGGLTLDTTGNTRGTGSLDIQSTRTAVTQVASGACATALGIQNTACGCYSSAVGYDNTVSAYGSTFGFNNVTYAMNGTAVGRGNNSCCLNASSVGFFNTAGGVCSVAFGSCNIACLGSSAAVGAANTASGNYAAAFGVGTPVSHNTASGSYSSAFGVLNTASGVCSSAFGYKNTASACLSSAFGSCLNNSIANSTMLGPSTSAALQVLSSGNVNVAGTLQLPASSGLATLVAGTVTVTPGVPIDSNTLVMCTAQTESTNFGSIGISATTTTTFTIKSSNSSDTSNVAWEIIQK